MIAAQVDDAGALRTGDSGGGSRQPTQGLIPFGVRCVGRGGVAENMLGVQHEVDEPVDLHELAGYELVRFCVLEGDHGVRSTSRG